MFVLSFKATRSATRKRSNFLSTPAQILLSQLVPNTGKAIVLHRTSHRARKVTNEHMHVSQKMLASEPTSLKESQKKVCNEQKLSILSGQKTAECDLDQFGGCYLTLVLHGPVRTVESYIQH